MKHMINIEYKNEQGHYPVFESKLNGKKVAVLYDINTAPYAEEIIKNLQNVGATVLRAYFPDKELIPNEYVLENTAKIAKNADYLLAVGSGSLNDVAKKVSYDLSIECGVLATAASMDGYCSKGAALMQGDFKITFDVHTPCDVLVDPEIIKMHREI